MSSTSSSRWGDAVARAIVNRLLHEPTLQMREMRDDRVHARMALVRELFGLSADEPALDAGEQQPLAEIRELPRSVHARSTRRS